MRGPLVREGTRQRLHRLRRPAWLGTMRRVTPLSSHWGRERGAPIDRYYIDQFLASRAEDIHGRVLEVMDTRYTSRFGRDVERADVLDVDDTNPRATIVADLAAPGTLPEEAFDCFVLTQTLQFVFDLDSAVLEVHRALRSGGVVLATLPAVSKIDHTAGVAGDFWRFTAASCSTLFGKVFGPDRVEVESYGNVLTGVAFLMGMAAEELRRPELEHRDVFFPVLIGVRAVKP